MVSKKSSECQDKHYIYIDVMTMPDGKNVRKLCNLCISKEELHAVLDLVD
jgi:hypothetical protein